MIPLHPVPYIGAPLLLVGLHSAALAACLGCPLLALGAGVVALASAALMTAGGAL